MAKQFRLPVLFIILVSLACASGPAPAAGTPGIPGVKEATTPVKAGWQNEWDKAVAAAKAEGTLMAYTVHSPEFRVPVAQAFKERFGINTEWVAGRGTDILPKLTQERRAGLFLADVMISGVNTLNDIAAQSGLDALEPALVLPDVKDVKLWRDERLHFLDPERRILAYLSRTGSTILINSEMVRTEEIKSYRDLLSPKWKGKMVINDPTGTGAGTNMLTTVQILMGQDFLRELAKQDPVIIRDQRQQVEWVARGKYPVLLGPSPMVIAEFRKLGAPLSHIIPSEGTWSGAGGGMIGLFSRPAHPAAAKVFVNWLLTKDGQTVWVKAALEQSRRLDVTTEYIDADRRLQDGVKYIDGDSASFVQKSDETMTISKSIFAAQLK